VRHLICALLLLATSCARSRESRARRDGGAARGDDAAVVAPGPDAFAARPPLPDEERAALTGTIEVAAGREGQFRIDALDPRGDAAPRRRSPDDGASYYPAPGPRSLAIATTERGAEHLEQLVLLDRGPLGEAMPRIRHPSSDGAAVVFEAAAPRCCDLYRIELGSGALTRLTDDPAGNFEPALSADGARIAFVSSRDGDAELYAMPAAGGAPTRLTFFHKDDWSPRWSPDDAWLAFLSDREGEPRIFLIRPDGSELRPAHDGAADAEEKDLAWSPDGSRLAVVRSGRDGSSEIWVIDVAAASARRISAPGARDEAPSWSPDGRHLVYVSTRDQRIDLWIARADGSAESRLTTTPEEEWIPRWRP
jgi:hypothetical protein